MLRVELPAQREPDLRGPTQPLEHLQHGHLLVGLAIEFDDLDLADQQDAAIRIILGRRRAIATGPPGELRAGKLLRRQARLSEAVENLQRRRLPALPPSWIGKEVVNQGGEAGQPFRNSKWQSYSVRRFSNP